MELVRKELSEIVLRAHVQVLVSIIHVVTSASSLNECAADRRMRYPLNAAVSDELRDEMADFFAT